MPPQAPADRPPPPAAPDHPHHLHHPHHPQDRYPPDCGPAERYRRGPSVGAVIGSCAVAAFQIWVIYRVIRMSSQTNKMYEALVESK